MFVTLFIFQNDNNKLKFLEGVMKEFVVFLAGSTSSARMRSDLREKVIQYACSFK